MNKKHVPLIAAIALPVIFIIILVITIVTPSVTINPEFDFVYVDPSEQYRRSFDVFEYKNRYDVKDGKIIKVPIEIYVDPMLKYPEDIQYEDAPTLYLYDIEENTSREISFEEAQEFMFDRGPSSPDGYTIKFEYNNDGIFELFGSGNNDSGYFIVKGSGKKQLTGIDNTMHYYGDGEIDLIGWIK